MRKVNNKLIQYCKDNDFPIDEMGEDYFKVIYFNLNKTSKKNRGVIWHLHIRDIKN